MRMSCSFLSLQYLLEGKRNEDSIFPMQVNRSAIRERSFRCSQFLRFNSRHRFCRACAKSRRRDVRGTIIDEQGAAVAGAEVAITNAQAGLSRNRKSGTDGAYSFTELPLGIYNIHVTHAGFKAETQTGIALHVNDSLVLNVPLRVGAISETVTVEASPVEVETTSGELTGLIQASQVSELPLNGRNFMQLITLIPGVAPAEAFSVTNKGLKGASDVSVSGSPSNGNQWLVDGANNNDTGSQRTILIYPSTESIQEFKIERNSYGAEFGLMAGATISLVTCPEAMASTAAFITLDVMTSSMLSTRNSRQAARLAPRTSSAGTTTATPSVDLSKRTKSFFSGLRNGTSASKG